MYCFATNVIPHRCHVLFIISFNGKCQRGLLIYFFSRILSLFSPLLQSTGLLLYNPEDVYFSLSMICSYWRMLVLSLLRLFISLYHLKILHILNLNKSILISDVI